MKSAAGFLNTIILLGALQGFIVCGLLFFVKTNRQTNRLLAVLIGLMSLACFNLYANYKNFFGSDVLRFITNFLPMIMVMCFGPLIYFYIQSLLDPCFKFARKQRVHFYPVIIDLVPSLAAIFYILILLTGLVKNNPAPIANFIDTWNVYADIPRWLSVSFYLWLSYKYLRNLKTKNNVVANGPNFKWLQQFIYIFLGFQVVWFVFLIPYVIPRFSNALLDAVDWYPIYIPLAVLVYWLGIKGYAVSQQQAAPVKKTLGIHQKLSSAAIDENMALLQKSMHDDQLYLNPNLNLSLVAEHTGIAQKTISALLNQHLQKSFSDFVNEYRVATFKEKIQQPEAGNFTIAGVAFECGFNSQATFQRTFKQITGVSPSEFRKGGMLFIEK